MKKLIARVAVVTTIAFAVIGGSVEAWAERRVALVIGNAAYKVANVSLTNPRNDAEDVSTALKTLGFEVITRVDADKHGMEAALQKFARDAIDADSALFFYAGHAMQFQGRNYLMPTDAELEDEISVRYQTISLEEVQSALDRVNGVKIMILDACRNNPLADRLQKKIVGASRTVAATTRGLARIDKTQGMVVAYATAADEVAQDGQGRNSPFTAALLKRMQEPGLEIEMMFRRVAYDVNNQTGGRQRPETHISLLSEYYLNQSDRIVWERIRDQDDIAALRDFVNKYPSSPSAIFARNRLELLERFAKERREAEERLRAEQLAAQKRAEEEQRKKQEEAALLKKQQEEAALLKRRQEEALLKKQQEEALLKKQQEEALLKKQQEEALLKKQQEEALLKKQQEEAALLKRRQDEALLKKQQEEAALLKRQQEETLLKKQQEEAALLKRQQDEALLKKQQEEAALLKKQQEEALLKKQQEETALLKRQQEEALLKRQQDEALLKKQQEDALLKRQQEERLAALEQQQKVDPEIKRIEDTCLREEARLANLRTAGTSARDQLVKFEAEAECKLLRPRIAAAIAALPPDVLPPAVSAVPSPATQPKANLPEQIAQAQTELKRLGCFKGPLDSKLSDATVTAIKTFWIKTRKPIVEISITEDFIADLKQHPSDICSPPPAPKRQPEANLNHHQPSRNKEAANPPSRPERPAPAQPVAPQQPAAHNVTHALGTGF